MDPDVALTKLREAAQAYWAACEADDVLTDQAIEHAGYLAEAAQDLDEWLSKGSFPPKDWAPAAKGWELRMLDACTWLVKLNGKLITTIRYDGRGTGAWGFYTSEYGQERYSHPTEAFRVIMDRYEGKS